MVQQLLIDLPEPRFEQLEEHLIAGLGSRYTFKTNHGDTNQGIPALWQRFAPHIGRVPAQAGPETYGVSCHPDSTGVFEYIAGVRVSRFAELPEGFITVRIPAGRYAVFTHALHVSMLPRTHYTIWNRWFPESGLHIAPTPNFERYGVEFNPLTGMGQIDIWMPLAEGTAKPVPAQ